MDICVFLTEITSAIRHRCWLRRCAALRGRGATVPRRWAGESVRQQRQPLATRRPCSRVRWCLDHSMGDFGIWEWLGPRKRQWLGAGKKTNRPLVSGLRGLRCFQVTYNSNTGRGLLHRLVGFQRLICVSFANYKRKSLLLSPNYHENLLLVPQLQNRANKHLKFWNRADLVPLPFYLVVDTVTTCATVTTGLLQ
jgi:hypothetical protein